MVAVLALAAGASCAGAEAAAGASPAGAKKSATKGLTMDRLLVRVALDSTGEPYLEAEKELVAAGPRVGDVVRAEAARGGPLERAVAAMLLGWERDGKTWGGCLERMDAMEAKMKPTAIGTPLPANVAEVLFRDFGPTCVPLLAVRLLKQIAAWPSWKTFAAIFYLERAADPAALEPLVRLLWTVTDDEVRGSVVDALRALPGDDVRARVKEELARLETASASLRAVTAPSKPK